MGQHFLYPLIWLRTSEGTQVKFVQPQVWILLLHYRSWAPRNWCNTLCQPRAMLILSVCQTCMIHWLQKVRNWIRLWVHLLDCFISWLRQWWNTSQHALDCLKRWQFHCQPSRREVVEQRQWEAQAGLKYWFSSPPYKLVFARLMGSISLADFHQFSTTTQQFILGIVWIQ